MAAAKQKQRRMSKRASYSRKGGFVLAEVLLWMLLLEALFAFGISFYPVLRQRFIEMRRNLACLGASDVVLTAQEQAMLECAAIYSVEFTGNAVETHEVEKPVRCFDFSECGLDDFTANGRVIRFTHTGNVKQDTRFSIESTKEDLPTRVYYLEPVRGRLVYEE
jgi:hypothetical protein